MGNSRDESLGCTGETGSNSKNLHALSRMMRGEAEQDMDSEHRQDTVMPLPWLGQRVFQNPASMPSLSGLAQD